MENENGSLSLQQVEDDSAEAGFMKGYSNEEKIEECAECGGALRESKVVKQFDDEAYGFCSKDCVEDFADSI